MPSNNLKEFTRGGQTTMHAIRMFWQSIKYIISISVFCAFLCWGALIMHFTTPYERYVFGQYLHAEVESVFSDKNEPFVIKDGQGVNRRTTLGRFLAHQDVAHNNYKIRKAVLNSTYLSVLGLVVLLALFVGVFLYRGGKHKEKDILRGPSKSDAKTVSKMLKKEKRASEYRLGDLPIVKDSETRNILVAGSQGTGKTNLQRQFMAQVREKGGKIVCYDADTGWVSKLYRPDKDIILCPTDARMPLWNIWQECVTSSDFESIAESLIPMRSGNTDPFWVLSARTILSVAAFAMKNKQPTTRKLLGALLTESLDNIKEIVKDTAAETLVSEKIEKTALSIKSTLSNDTKSLLYLPDDSIAKPDEFFSIRKWLQDDSIQDSTLFIVNDIEASSAIKPLISCWIDVAFRALLGLSEDDDLSRRVWFFIDELPDLHKLPTLPKLLFQGRKRGAAAVVGIQDMHQLKDEYGENGTYSMLQLLNTIVCLRTPCHKSAEWAEKTFGSQEVVEIREGVSYGADTLRDGVTLNQERRKSPIVMDSEFMYLNDFEAYIKLAGNVPVVKTKTTFTKMPNVAKGRIAREMEDAMMISRAIVNEAEASAEAKPIIPKDVVVGEIKNKVAQRDQNDSTFAQNKKGAKSKDSLQESEQETSQFSIGEF